MDVETPAPLDRITVLLVDDHALVRGGLRRLLDDDPMIHVVGELDDGADAVRAVTALAPTVVILDYVLPGADGLVTLRRILESRPSAAVLMLSMRDDERLVQEALAAGAKGFVVKDAIDIRLDDAVRRVAGGEIVLSAGVASFRDRPSAEVRLTSRQLQVLRLICRGRSARAIGAELGLSEHTVRVHRAGIMRALRIHRTTALVSYAIRYGLVDPSEPGAGGGAQSSSS